MCLRCFNLKMDLVCDIKMVKIPKLYSFICLGIPFFIILLSSTVTANCDYALCKLHKQQSDESDYFASGGAVSSQYSLPDGSVLTNSKESTLSSNGIKKTFHELKKEADRFVQSSSNQESFNAISKVPGIIPVPDIPIPQISHRPITSIPFPYLSSSSGQQSSYSQTQLEASNSAAAVQQQYEVTAPKVSSYSNEHEIKQKVVATSKGTLEYPRPVASQYHVVNTNTNSDTSVPLTFPGGPLNLNYHDVSSSYNTVSGGNPVAVVSSGVPVVSSSQSSSYQSSSSSSQSTSGGNQVQAVPVYGNVQPSSFHTGILSLNPVYSSSLPKAQVNSVRVEEHYKQDSRSEVPNAVPGYNVVGSPITIQYQQEDHYGKSKDQEGSAIKPAASAVNAIQYSVANSSHLHSESHSGLPTVHDSEMIVNVKPGEVASSGYQHESASSQVASRHHVAGEKYSSPGVAYVPAVNEESNQSQNKQHYSSSQSFGFQSPVLLHGVPQNIPLNLQEASYSNTGSNYHGNGYSEGAADGVAVPVLVHGVPQTIGQKISSSSKSSSSNYYSSSNNGAVVPSSSGYYYSEGDASLSKTNGASASIYDSAAVNANAENLCVGCFNKVSSLGHSTGVGLPIEKSSYGISTSFSSHSSSVNGKKTSESREAAVAVNDNGKVDSYHVKS